MGVKGRVKTIQVINSPASQRRDKAFLNASWLCIYQAKGTVWFHKRGGLELPTRRDEGLRRVCPLTRINKIKPNAKAGLPYSR